MPKRLIRARRSFAQQAKMRRAKGANAAYTGGSTQSKGVRLSCDGRRLIMSRSERRWTAYHEAGHAVIHAVLGIRFRLVTIIPSGHLLGRVEREQQPIWRRPPTTHAYVRRIVLCLLAGGIAEQFARRDGQASGLAQDFDSVLPLIAHLPGSRMLSGRRRRHFEMHLQADTLVRRHWYAIDEVARRLIRDKTLMEHQVFSILRWTPCYRALADLVSSDQALELSFHNAEQKRVRLLAILDALEVRIAASEVRADAADEDRRTAEVRANAAAHTGARCGKRSPCAGARADAERGQG